MQFWMNLTFPSHNALGKKWHSTTQRYEELNTVIAVQCIHSAYAVRYWVQYVSEEMHHLTKTITENSRLFRTGWLAIA